MPLIDVSELMTDPDFATTFSVVRTTVGVSSTGMTQETPSTTANVVGIITPNTNALMRLAEGAQLQGSINVYTRYRLTAGNATYAADEIIWNGSNYVITEVSDWSQWGSGFVRGIGSLKPMQPAQ